MKMKSSKLQKKFKESHIQILSKYNLIAKNKKKMLTKQVILKFMWKNGQEKSQEEAQKGNQPSQFGFYIVETAYKSKVIWTHGQIALGGRKQKIQEFPDENT